jgi:hypothetical protein
MSPTATDKSPVAWRRLVQIGDIAVSDNCDVHQIAALMMALAPVKAAKPTRCVPR